MVSPLLKVADVLEKAAALIDASESEKTASETAKRSTEIDDMARKFRDATGEDLPGDVRAKIASDASTFAAVKAVIEKTGGAVASLGQGGKVDGSTTPPPSSKEEATRAAYDRFGSYLSAE